MKFLLDLPVPDRLLDVIRAYGHEGLSASSIGHHQATDAKLLDLAQREGRVVITASLDFPRLLVLNAAGPGVILFRGGNYSDEEMVALLEGVLAEVRPELLATSICVIDKKRIRLTSLPLNLD